MKKIYQNAFTDQIINWWYDSGPDIVHTDIKIKFSRNLSQTEAETLRVIFEELDTLDFYSLEQFGIYSDNVLKATLTHLSFDKEMFWAQVISRIRRDYPVLPAKPLYDPETELFFDLNELFDK